ncbi:BREX-1 system adenine-specific DNA-methyltransferase PglX [Desulfobacterales bacterium HSG16]|nr:BREX-1 system adenine-specific DNA-methyltransferase PglX [Desulfobacterales bacterium HSG16]
MNTSKIKAYAPQARRDFIKAITERANAFGIYDEKRIEPVEISGDVAMIAGRVFPKKEGLLREKLVNRVKQEGFQQVVEACAFSWFNRFVAIRYMELHDFLGHGFRVLSNHSESDVPEILENAADVEFDGLKKERVIELRIAGDKDNELYRLLIIAQCSALHRTMPFLFDKMDSETLLLLPDNLLHSNSPIRSLVNDIDEKSWQEVEIIGWIYQFYISEKKDQVIGKVVKSEDIPAATQLFTPNWIVKYMVQNTLGRMWLATYPDSGLRDKMEYYIEPAEQEPEVQAELDRITPKELDPEEITFLDPACGSGHILIEAYAIFKEIYLERGYRTRDIPRLILEKNIFGLDICDRAAQLACFAVLMKAREDDRRILRRDELKLNVIAIQESDESDLKDIEIFFGNDDEEEVREGLKELVGLFKDAKTFGSLLTVPENLVGKKEVFETAIEKNIDGIFEIENVELLKNLLLQAEILERKYDCVVTNPPYMGGKGMNPNMKAFAKKHFPASKSDLFAIFIERIMNMVQNDRYIGIMTPLTWMFLSSYLKLREKILNQKTLTSLIRPEYHAFFESAYVPLCTFTIFSTQFPEFKGDFIDLTEFYGAELQAPKTLEAIQNPSCGWRYTASAADFKKIPGSPIAYWVSTNLRNVFGKFNSFGNVAVACQGLATTDNNRFIRQWSEVNFSNIGFGCLTEEQSVDSLCKWFPIDKGGGFRKWYGNHESIVNWENAGFEIRQTIIQKYPYLNGKPDFVAKNPSKYFLEGITWGKITSSDFSARFSFPGSLFSDAGMKAFSKINGNPYSICGFFNSKLCNYFLGVISQTLNYEQGNIAKLPFDYISSPVVKTAIHLAKSDWDIYETSWDFTNNPLLKTNHYQLSIKATFINLGTHLQEMIHEMQRLEEENNRIFIETYSLQNEISPDVPLSKITLVCNPHYRYSGKKTEEELETLLQTDTIKELISYSIGCMMGRYSLDHPGLIYAHSSNIDFDESKYKTFSADDDGIIPIMDQEWFSDDVTKRFVEFLKVAWTPETLEENLKFVADSLKPKTNESSVDTIRRYIGTGFFKDHLKTYKKRPIYWLFSSGKQKAFQCMVYLHRYNESTLSRMRSSYVTPLQGHFSARIEFLQNEKDSAKTASAQRKVQKTIELIRKKQAELRQFDDELRHYADMKISIDLDDGVKVNYGKFGNLLAEKKAITGKK